MRLIALSLLACLAIAFAAAGILRLVATSRESTGTVASVILRNCELCELKWESEEDGNGSTLRLQEAETGIDG
jgi:hypothetical protein